jgi:hypothetical protein
LCLQHFEEVKAEFYDLKESRQVVIDCFQNFVFIKHLDAAYQFWMSTLETSAFSKEEFYVNVLQMAENDVDLDTIQWVLKQDPRLAPFSPTAYFQRVSLNGQSISQLKFIVENGYQLTTQDFWNLINASPISKGQPFECLKYVHEKFDFSLHGISFPIECKRVPLWATKESMQWMKDHQYRFPKETMLDDYLKWVAFKGEKMSPWDQELMAWMLSEGAPVTQETLLHAACTCNLELLNWLWGKKPEAWRLDYPFLNIFLSRLFLGPISNLIPIKRTVQWLLSKGYSCCDALHAAAFINKFKPFYPKQLELLLIFVKDLGLPYDIEQLKQK